MRFYEMFYGIEEKKMKEYIIPIEDIIVKPELFYAHCDRDNGKKPELLKERFRCHKFGFEDMVILIACGLHNFRISHKMSHITN